MTDDFINGLWSESKWFYLNNAYNKYIDNINSNNNEKFEKSNVALDSILSLYDVEIKEPTTYFMTNEITAKINTHFKTNLTSNAVGEALKLSFEYSFNGVGIILLIKEVFPVP